MSKGYNEWHLNHIHPVGQDGFKSDEIYLQNHPLCEAVFYCSFYDSTFVAKASEKHYCNCGSVSLATRIELRKMKSNYANIRG